MFQRTNIHENIYEWNTSTRIYTKSHYTMIFLYQLLQSIQSNFAFFIVVFLHYLKFYFLFLI